MEYNIVEEGCNMRIFVILFIALFISGCENPDMLSQEKPSKEEEKKRHGIFWQLESPKIQLDPVEAEEIPLVVWPDQQER